MTDNAGRLRMTTDQRTQRSAILVFSLLSAAVFIAFCAVSYRCALMTDDDTLVYLYSLNPNYIKYAVANALYQGRVMSVPIAYLARLPFVSASLLGYKLFTYASLLVVAGSIGFLCYRHVDKAVGGLAFLLFFAMAQIDLQHNLFYSYVLSHQIPLALLIFSLERLLTFYRDAKKSALVASAILFTCSAMLYESFVLMSVVVGVMALLSMNREKNRSFRNVIFELRYHILFLSIYLLVYFLWRILYPSVYDGTVFEIKDPLLSLRTVVTYTIGLFPLRPFLDLPNTKAALATIDPLILAVALTGAVAAGIALWHVKSISRRTVLQTTLLCVLGMLLPNVLLGLTPMKAEWVALGSTSYVTSFYSFAFLVMLLSAWAGFAASRISRKWIVTAVVVPSLFALFVLIGISNKAYAERCDARLDRLETFAAVVATDSFASVENGSVIYMPDSTGLHGSMDALNVYSASIYAEGYQYVNRAENLTFAEPTYMLRYDASTSTAIFGRIDEAYTSDEVTFVNLSGLGTESYLMKPDRILLDIDVIEQEMSLCEPRAFHVEGSVVRDGPFDGLISFADPTATEAVIPCDDSDMTFIRRMVYDTSNAKVTVPPMKDASSESSNAATEQPVDMAFPYGFYAPETWPAGELRWAGGDAALIFRNTAGENQPMILKMTAATPLDETNALAIRIGDEVITYPVSANAIEIRIPIELPPGETPVTFSCDAATSGPIEDPRELVFYLVNLRLDPA